MRLRISACKCCEILTLSEVIYNRDKSGAGLGVPDDDQAGVNWHVKPIVLCEADFVYGGPDLGGAA